MHLKAVFLDVGNTLLHEVPRRAAIYAEVGARHGVELDPDAMHAHMLEVHRELPPFVDGAFRYSDPWFREFIRRIFGDRLGVAADAVVEIEEQLFARFEDPATFRYFPGAEALLTDLRAAGLRLGLISNWSARLPRLLEGLGLTRRVDFTLCSAIEGVEKPAPELFRAALERAGVAPDEALHCGDHPVNDVRGARAVGLRACLVDHHDRLPAGSEGDAGRVGSLVELRSYILGSGDMGEA
jgi:putative hydrolase of the HAD superfamily